MAPPCYLIITPVKDEERYIGQTIKSVLGQTLKPYRWVIVDDDSTDRTVELIKPFCERYPWIQLIQTRRGPERRTGFKEASAFNFGYEAVKDLDFEYVVKLDGDILFGKDYFEKLLEHFEKDDTLGIASGIYFEKDKKGWKAIPMPEYHAAGASKVVRRRCFELIGGFLTTPGWDSVDQIRAHSLGWKTCHFKEIHFFHLRNEGSDMGYLKTNMMHGEIYYLTGGSKWFFLFKVIHRILLGRPIGLGGIMMLIGFLTPMIQRKKLLVSPEEAKLYRQRLDQRILRAFRLG
jgi:glycosyltransferase involved in cell wall biosynthesis